jgi:cell wall-associated NlpC family hydrolase
MSISTVDALPGPGMVPERVRELQARFGAARPASTTGVGSTSFADALASASTDGTSSGSGVTGDQIVAEAKKYVGVPYVWGGNDPNTGLDCSGFVKLVASKFGIDLPRVAADQARQGTPVASLAEAKPGDLLAFGSPVTHIGIYLGGGKMIDASARQNSIVVRDVWETPSAIRRITSSAPAAAAYPTGGTGDLGGLDPSTPFASLFAQAGAKYGIEPKLLAAVAQVESGFNPKAGSGAGAQGLMQFMPGTARGMGVDPWDPAIDGAARLLADNRSQFGSTELALAAYNAGGGAVQRFGGIPPYAETQNYVRKVMAIAGGTA